MFASSAGCVRNGEWPESLSTNRAVGGFTELWELTRRTEVAALLGTWLNGKDWRDLFPSKRDTAAWSLLPHRVPRD